MEPVIQARELRKVYRDRRGRKTVALDGLDLEIAGPGVHGLLGPNGSGKTTAIRCALGLVLPSSGSVQVFGADSRKLQPVAARVGALVESPKFTPTMSGRTNLELFAAMSGINRARVHEVLELVELADRADSAYSSYSLGMGQRLGIAAALLRDPQLLILDEPTNGLDPAGIADMRRLIRNLAGEGRSVLLSSHNLHEVQQVCDRVIVMREGRSIAAGTVAELIHHATTAPRMIVVVNDRAPALEILERSGLDVLPGLDPRQLIVQLPVAGSAADITRVLAHEGIFVTEIRPDAVSLEDAFLSLTATPANPAVLTAKDAQ